MRLTNAIKSFEIWLGAMESPDLPDQADDSYGNAAQLVVPNFFSPYTIPFESIGPECAQGNPKNSECSLEKVPEIGKVLSERNNNNQYCDQKHPD
jgi:hypothetical protein